MSRTGLGYDVSGPDDAPVLVLGGSLGTTRAMWDPQRDALAERFRVVRYDHLGHGESEVPAGPYTLAQLGREVLGLLDQLGVRTFSYAGLSLGGMVGMWLAAHAPERVERLVLLCTSAQLGPAEAWTERAATVRAHGPQAVADVVVARWFTTDFVAARPEIFAAYRDMLVATPREGYAGCCEAIAAMDLRGDLARISAPTLVVAGGEDPATPAVHTETIAAAVPTSRLEVVDHAAHLASVEQADTVTHLLLEHLCEGSERHGRP